MAGLRVLHLVCGEGFAGVERHVATLARAQREAGLAVAVAGGAPGLMRASLEGTGIRWHPAPSMPGAFAVLLRAGGADVVHTHMSAADLVGVSTAWRHRAPVVSTRHFAAHRGKGGVRRVVMGRVARGIAAQISISRYVADAIEGPSTVVYPGVAALDARSAREPVVLLAQRLEPEKKTEVAIEAWAALGSRRRDWKLVIAGDGSQRAALEALARARGVDDTVVFLGFQANVAELLCRASIVVATTPAEGLGLSVLEAMSAGTPVVAPGSGGYLETVGATADAVLYRPADPTDLAARLDLLMSDELRRAAYGEALREQQRRHFSPETQARETLRVYESVVR
jgi:glycosyltransferase involved in cell wall biosynthesis